MSLTVTELSSTESIDQEGHQTYTSRYRVRSTTPLDNPITIRSATGLPSWGDSYTWQGVSNVDAFLHNIDTQFEHEDQTRLNWIVTCTYSTKPLSRDQAQNLRQSPLDEQWEIGGSFMQTTRIAWEDYDGLPITNSALQPQPQEVPDGEDTLTLEGPSATISLALRAQAVFHCNSHAIWGLAPRQLLCTQWQFSVKRHGSTEYIHNRLHFGIKYLKWNARYFDYGTREFTDDTETATRLIRDPEDGSVGSPHFLKAGRVLTPEQVLSGGAHYYDRPVIPEFDFRLLGFPDPLPGPFV
jgi:hypothetical protein